jgi:hypothetical protein
MKVAGKCGTCRRDENAANRGRGRADYQRQYRENRKAHDRRSAELDAAIVKSANDYFRDDGNGGVYCTGIEELQAAVMSRRIHVGIV